MDFCHLYILLLIDSFFSPHFYATFWTCSIFDIQCPIEAYEKQRVHLQDLITKLEKQRETITSNSETYKLTREHEKYTNLIELLHKEEQQHKEHSIKFIESIEGQKHDWFPKDVKVRAEIITEFLNQCIYPRCLLSEIDSLFCAKFINLVHRLKIPEFSTIICYDRIFMNITLMLASCTECEADRYGRFLTWLLETAMTWHSSRQIYEKECLNYPGFLTSFRYSLNASKPSHKEEKLTFENYRHVCHKWHYLLTLCFVGCLESSDYIQIRNSLKILIRLLPNYPKITGMYCALEKRIDRIRQTEKDTREDLCTLAICYLGQLRMKRNQMIEEYQFHDKSSQSNEASSNSSPALSSNTLAVLADSTKKSDGGIANNRSSTEEINAKTEVSLEKAKIVKTESPYKQSTQMDNRRNMQRASANGKHAISSALKDTGKTSIRSEHNTTYKPETIADQQHLQLENDKHHRLTTRERKRPDRDSTEEGNRKKRIKSEDKMSPLSSSDPVKKLNRVHHDTAKPVVSSSEQHHYHSSRSRTFQR
ncbi:hypothetical protein GJ496_003231 [Pomphorhynchus laevis]|nr:hypothetical protein GJ496_003231 [Pomphorhynchus laevis]